MMSVWHLAWIVPVCVSFGIALVALFNAGR